MLLRRLASYPGAGTMVQRFFLRPMSKSVRPSLVRGRSRRGARDEEDRGGEGRVHLHKSRGQHLLTNPRVLDAIVTKSGVGPSDTVLEIGPGTGNLTLKLLEKAGHVVAVEIDKRLVEILHSRVVESGLEDRITVICGDALKTQFPHFDLCVANIPYGISSPLILKMLFGTHNFRSATLLLQKEFAKRLLANPGDPEFNRLAVNVKLVSDVQFLMDVSKKDFVPCPKVDSSLVRIQPKPEIPLVDLEEWGAFVRTCFSKKNKTLGAIFKQKKKVIELMIRSKRVVITGRHRGLCVEDRGVADDDNIDPDMSDDEELAEEDGSDTTSNKESALFKDKIVSLLNDRGYTERRPSKLSNEQLLSLLSAFNEAGVYFCG
ncbi:Ribosomal RNA small subunit methyltransferase [Nymphaea thermarum]|nr:Ribosomal RNA small subunit methyltransferase [Nymphaea thermarum]